jgi:hypothetical protein
VTDPHDPFERELTDRLEAIVHGEAAPFELVDRAAARTTELAHQRRLRRGVTGAGLAALVTAAVWLIAVANPIGNGTQHQDTVAFGPDGHRITTTTEAHHPTSSTSSSTSTTEPEGASTTTTTRHEGATGGGPVRSTTTTSVAATTLSTLNPPEGAPEPKCVQITGPSNSVHDSWDEDYRRFWTTQPPEDQPLTLQVCVDDVTPKKGQEVTLTVTADDPDQTFSSDTCSLPNLFWGDEANPKLAPCRDTVAPAPQEPAPVPEPSGPGHLQKTFTHTYSSTGPSTIHVDAGSGPDAPGPLPYSSTASADLPIAVH